jgi:hypothetical protein
MNDDLFTPALWVFGIVLGSVLAFFEMLWLKRPFHFAVDWPGLPVVALVNAGFIYLMAGIGNSYYLLFIFPLPVIPVAYLLLKALAYFVVKRITHSPVHSPWKLVFLSLFFNSAVSLVAYGGFAGINPTLSNLKQAIGHQNNGLLDVMLWISVKFEPNMTILVNEAITDGNDDAVRRLLRRGADPRQDYRLREGSRATQWRIAKWMLDRGVKPEEFTNVSQSPPFTDIALGHGTAELEYCIQKGFDPKRYPGVIAAAISEHPLRERHVIRPDEVQALQDKIVLLLNHGADINGKGEMGFPPIFTILFMDVDLSPVLTLMIEKGADVNTRSPNKLYPENSGELPPGMTPLMLAVVNKYPQYAAILLKSGADKTIRDDKGLTALDYARKLKADDATMQLLHGVAPIHADRKTSLPLR